MATIYINLHPNYDYALAVIKGFIDVREYIKNVEWLTWELASKSGNRKIRISGDLGDRERAKEQHLERAMVFAQRMIQAGAEVLVRNERSEEWKALTFTNKSSGELLEVECKRDKVSDQERWARENLAKYQSMLADTNSLSSEQTDLLRRMIQEEEDRLQIYLQNEADRISALKALWV